VALLVARQESGVPGAGRDRRPASAGAACAVRRPCCPAPAAEACATPAPPRSVAAIPSR